MQGFAHTYWYERSFFIAKDAKRENGGLIMEELYPVVIDGRLVGEMKIYKEGLMTVFDADLCMCEGILRLSAYGGGGEGYIGVLAPMEERLRLRKSLSPSAMRAMPSPIEFVTVSGLQTVAVSESGSGEEGGELEGDILPKAVSAETKTGAVEEIIVAAEKTDAPHDMLVSLFPAEAEPLDKLKGEGDSAGDSDINEDMLKDVFWYSSPDGALVCFNGERSLIALPEGDARIPNNIPPIKKTIEGVLYFIYITRNGRIIG